MFMTPLKIDIHTHILPDNWPNLREKYGYDGFIQLEHHGPGCARLMRGAELFREIEANCWDAEIRKRECDATGVQMQVLSTVPVLFNYWAKPGDALDFSVLLNDHIAGVISAHPNRFAGLGTVPMQAPALAIKELERCVKTLGLAGIQIGSNINDVNLNDPSLFPVFEAAAELDAAVFVHPWDVMGQAHTARYWLPWLVGMPAETSRAICSMIFGGIFERLPDLRVGFAHGGGSFPMTVGRIEHGFNVRPTLCAIDNDVNPREYLGHFYVDALVHEPDVLRYLVNLIGADRIAMGSDYPFPLGESIPGAMIASMEDLDETTKDQLLSGTAMDWLGLDRKLFV